VSSAQVIGVVSAVPVENFGDGIDLIFVGGHKDAESTLFHVASVAL
jgi:hypothetical protein